jgi:hypothetical protein
MVKTKKLAKLRKQARKWRELKKLEKKLRHKSRKRDRHTIEC